MASNEITFKVKVEKDGNLKVLATDAEKAAKGTDKLTGSTDNLSKSQNRNNAVEKSLYQSGLSTAKGFSKQASAISGGLVPAYAVLAANIFIIYKSIQLMWNKLIVFVRNLSIISTFVV